jgi:hypothetical protein
MTDTLTVEIPADVRDNSETVTDYAFMKHRSPDRGVTTPDYRDQNISLADLFGYTLHSWHDVNQGDRNGWGAGQRCRFDMLVTDDGMVVHLFHTEYFTRVACHTGGFCHSYATHYALVVKDGEPTTDDPLPYCDEHLRFIEREDGLTVHRSERLLIGQHD